MFANFMYLATMVAFNIGQPWKKSFFTNKFFMGVFIFVFTYSVLICIVPAARLADFGLDFMVYNDINGFVLGISLAFGLTIYGLQKLVWEPLSIWLKEKYP